MNQERLQTKLIEFFFGESKSTLEEIAESSGVPKEVCVRELQRMRLIADSFSLLPEEQASQMTVNKILAHARERAAQAKRHPWWQVLFRPLYAASVVLGAGVVSILVWQAHQKSHDMIIASSETRLVNERLLATPFDEPPMAFQFKRPASRRYLNSNVSSAGLGQLGESFAMDEDLEFNLDPANLNEHDLETLYFRARKYEKLGYLKEALHDYIFIAKFYPRFDNEGILPLAIARCYEKLGNKQAALSILQNYQKTYGESEQVEFWIDQLKSETF